jgi:hypothetical protein
VRLRIYLDRFGVQSAIWSVDEGDTSTERRVKAIQCMVPTVTRSNPAADNKIEPKCWLEADGTLSVENGVAVIR